MRRVPRQTKPCRYCATPGGHQRDCPEMNSRFDLFERGCRLGETKPGLDDLGLNGLSATERLGFESGRASYHARMKAEAERARQEEERRAERRRLRDEAERKAFSVGASCARPDGVESDRLYEATDRGQWLLRVAVDHDTGAAVVIPAYDKRGRKARSGGLVCFSRQEPRGPWKSLVITGRSRKGNVLFVEPVY